MLMATVATTGRTDKCADLSGCTVPDIEHQSTEGATEVKDPTISGRGGKSNAPTGLYNS